MQPGARLGPYEILSPLGAGGMGEVWRARDTRLDRDVAIKVLPEKFFEDKESIARFEREAKSLAAVNHPHIAGLYSFEEASGRHVLVMELADGQTLSERLLKGPLAPDQVLKTAIEIASALDAAHRAGIVHRDLKPGNVMLTKSGAKLLDFGLAKAAASPVQPSDLTSRPTELPRNLTAKGTILGTLQYMAPEQLEGKEADARTDIFAFGAVLYEMATGRTAFAGATQASLITAIMSSEPAPISTIQSMTPPALDRAVRTCLAKDPDERWQSAHDVAAELRWISEGGGAPGVERTTAAPRRTLQWLGWGLAAGFAIIAALLAFRSPKAPPKEESVAIRSVIPPAAGSSLRFFGYDVGLALSPDGRNLAYVGSTPEGRAVLWLRPLDSLAARPLDGTDGATWPFWSPDGTEIGFFADSKLKTIHTASGAIRMLGETGSVPVGGSWRADGTIVFSPEWAGPLYRIAGRDGGLATPLTTLNAERKELGHQLPSLFAGGLAVLYVSYSSTRVLGISAARLDRSDAKLILPDSTMAAEAAGHLVFDRGDSLFAQKFDADRFTLAGQPVALARKVYPASGVSGFTGLLFSVAGDRALAYVEFGAVAGFRLLPMDRSGRVAASSPLPAFSTNLVVSPDGLKAAYDTYDPASNAREIQILDLRNRTRIRLPVASGWQASDPVWSGDGKKILYALYNDSDWELVERTIGADSDRVVLKTGPQAYPRDWSRDGRHLLYDTVEAGRSTIRVVPLSGDRKPVPFRRSAAAEWAGQFSPDGRFVAFTSNTSGRDEVYVAPVDAPDRAQIVSSSGGRVGKWRRDGKEIFYLSLADEMMVADVSAAGDSLSFGTPRRLFRARRVIPGWSSYGVSPDGQSFLVNAFPDESSARIVLIQNWTALLPR